MRQPSLNYWKVSDNKESYYSLSCLWVINKQSFALKLEETRDFCGFKIYFIILYNSGVPSRYLPITLLSTPPLTHYLTLFMLPQIHFSLYLKKKNVSVNLSYIMQGSKERLNRGTENDRFSWPGLKLTQWILLWVYGYYFFFPWSSFVSRLSHRKDQYGPSWEPSL